jgi:hypothetical protein
MRASSAYFRQTLTSSRRRSSLSGGITMRMTEPSLEGVTPRSDCRIAFSIAPKSERSHGWMTSIRGSGTEIFPTCEIGVGTP